MSSCDLVNVIGYFYSNVSNNHQGDMSYWFSWYSSACKALTLIARSMVPTWGPPGADRTQVGPMWAMWTLLSGKILLILHFVTHFNSSDAEDGIFLLLGTIPCLLMFLKSTEHQQAYYWLCRISNMLFPAEWISSAFVKPNPRNDSNSKCIFYNLWSNSAL